MKIAPSPGTDYEMLAHLAEVSDKLSTASVSRAKGLLDRLSDTEAMAYILLYNAANGDRKLVAQVVAVQLKGYLAGWQAGVAAALPL